MIFTSYFAKIKSLPDKFVPISIALKTPEGINIEKYKKLMPSYDILNNYRINKNKTEYVRRYNHEILENLNPHEVVKDLLGITGGKTIVLICYEAPDSFCHRHLVADWLEENGYHCEEFYS